MRPCKTELEKEIRSYMTYGLLNDETEYQDDSGCWNNTKLAEDAINHFDIDEDDEYYYEGVYDWSVDTTDDFKVKGV